MSRQNRNQLRDRKTDESKRDIAADSDRYSRQNREETPSAHQRTEASDISGLDKYRLNDLYERSSI